MRDKPDNYYDGCLTSPMYNANLKYANGKYVCKKKGNAGANKYINNSDDLPMDIYFMYQSSIIYELLRICNGPIFYNIQMLNGNKVALFNIFGRFSETIKEVFIWDKKMGEAAINRGCVNSAYEFIIIFDKNTPQKRSFDFCNFERGTFDNIIRISKNRGRKENKHSAGMPLMLAKTIISNFFKPIEKIIDPFGGMATTAIACEDLNINADLCELDKNYFEDGKKRLEQHRQQIRMF
jgi:DNA modification methylase